MSFTSLHHYFEDLGIGQEWESLARTVTEADVVNYAGLSGDFNPIHVDEEHARQTPYHRRIAHGLLVLSISGGQCCQTPPVRTLALVSIRDWQFRGPVGIGDTVRTRTRVLEKEIGSRGRRGKVTWQLQVLNQTNAVVEEGIIVTLVEGRCSSPCTSRHEPKATADSPRDHEPLVALTPPSDANGHVPA